MTNIRGNTTAGAAVGASAGMPLSENLPASPTGADTKGTEIAAELNAFLDTARTQTAIYNQSVTALRQGMQQVPQNIEATDQAGANTVANSGGTFSI